MSPEHVPSRRDCRPIVPRQSSTILCVDEDMSSLVDLKTCLELDGREVLITTSLRRGLELLASQRVDGVVLDYCMPLIHTHWKGDHGSWPSWADLLPRTPGAMA